MNVKKKYQLHTTLIISNNQNINDEILESKYSYCILIYQMQNNKIGKFPFSGHLGEECGTFLPKYSSPWCSWCMVLTDIALNMI